MAKKETQPVNPMNTRRKLALIYRWSLFSILVTFVCLAVKGYVFGSLYPARTVYIFKDAYITLPFTLSGWWKLAVFPFWFCLLIPTITTISGRVRGFLEMGMEEIDYGTVSVVAVINAIIGLFCFWISYVILTNPYVTHLGFLMAYIPSLIAAISVIIVNIREGNGFVESVRSSSIFLWLGKFYSITCGMILAFVWGGFEGIVLGLSCLAGVFAAEIIFLVIMSVIFTWITLFRFARGTYRGESHISSRLIMWRNRLVDWLLVRKHVHTNP